MLRLQFPNTLSAPEVLAPEGSVKIPAPKTADDINDMFKELDNEIPPKELVKEKEEVEKKVAKEDDELELKEADEEIEKLDLNEPEGELNIDAPPRKKEILKAYPDIFKNFPFLEKMMYRDKEYTELFGSFDDAKELAERAESFDSFETQLLSGNTEQILREVKENDEKAFNIIVDDYLLTLSKVDKEAYFHVVGNLNKRLIMEMVEEANSTNNDDLKQAALLVNQFIFGNSKFTAPSNRVEKRDNPEKDEVEQERLSLVKERFESARDDLQTQVDNTLRATISEYIDPHNKMSSYVKKNAVADAMKFLSEGIAADPNVVKNMDRLWRASFENKFSKDTLGRIKSYYLSRAKNNLKSAIIKARQEALKDLAPKRDKEEIEEENSPRQRRQIPPGRPSQSRGKTEGPQKGESVADYFARD